MQHDLIPQTLQRPCQQFLLELEQLAEQVPNQCPYCASQHLSQTRAEPLTFRCKGCLKYFNRLTATPFNRLNPVSWLATIFIGRVNRESYQGIAYQLGCDLKMVIRRDRAIMTQMQIRNPSLYHWYRAHNDINKQYQLNELPELLVPQHLALKQKVSELLTCTQANCLHCQSTDTVRVGQRTAFRCRRCLRSFNLLSGTPLNRLRDADKWLPFIDLLVTKQSNLAIAMELGLNNNTIGRWRRKWNFTMQQWGFAGLAAWCQR